MQKRLGFTLIELSLSIAFISILSLAVVFTITNAISAYRRGLTLNQVNTVGTELVDDMTTVIQASPVRQVKDECSSLYSDDTNKKNCEDDAAQKFVNVVRRGNVKIGGKDVDGVPLFGAFCTGKYSYVWNSGYFFNKEDYKVDNSVEKAQLKYKLMKGSSDERNNFKLLKVQDEERMVCKAAVKSDYNSEISNTFDIRAAGMELIEEPIELLSSGNLALYDLDVASPVTGASGREMLYSVSFILGTVQGGVNINAANDNCAAPADYDSAVQNFDYCSINKFNFVARAIGG